MRVLERLVFAFGDRHDDHLRALAEVEERGTGEVSHVFDEHEGSSLGTELREPGRDDVGVEVAARARIDLQDAATGLANPFGVEARRLIALDDGTRALVEPR